MFLLLNLLIVIAQISNRVNGVRLDAELLVANGYTNQSSFIGLSFKNIDSIDPNVFKDFPQASSISLVYNDLTNIDLQVFSPVKNLSLLDLTNNPIRKIINSDKKSSLNNLTTLYMSSIKVASFDTAPLIHTFPNLESLSFSSDQLDQLKPNQLVGWKKLQTLALSVNNQKSLTAKLFNGVQDSLSTLYIVSSGIKSIDYDSFDRLSNLSSITLTNNSLSAIIGLRIPSSLKSLILNKNRLTSFRPTSKFLSSINLDFLDLSENRFFCFSTINFNVLPKLTKLSLSSNPIVNPNLVFSQIQQAKALTRLELKELKISEISSGAFSKLPNLVNIILAENSITKIDNSTFSGLNKLYEINLSFNRIVQLDSASFANLPSLEMLILNSNRISSFSRDMISGSNNLNFINLENNLISSIAPGTFNNLVNLTMINLSANRLTDLDTNMFAGCTNLKSIFIRDNSISTDVINKLCPTSDCYVYY